MKVTWSSGSCLLCILTDLEHTTTDTTVPHTVKLGRSKGIPANETGKVRVPSISFTISIGSYGLYLTSIDWTSSVESSMLLDFPSTASSWTSPGPDFNPLATTSWEGTTEAALSKLLLFRQVASPLISIKKRIEIMTVVISSFNHFSNITNA